MNLTELFAAAAARQPQKPALIEGDEVVSYAALMDRSARLADRLQTWQIVPGSRIGLSYPNGIDYVALTIALWRVQAVVVPVPMECTAGETAELAAALQLAAIITRKLTRKPGEAGGPPDPDFDFARLSPAAPPDNHGLNLAFIRFTSGTTSARKGVALTHETIRDRITVANRALGITADDTVMWCLPMAHHFLITIVLYLCEGATVVLVQPVPAQPFLEAANRWRGTVLYAAPFHYEMLAGDASGIGLETVRLAVSTTCPLSPEVAENFFRRFGRPPVSALGIIELGLVSLNRDDPRGRSGSVGRPLADLRVRINDPDENGAGEVAVSGPGFLDAYVAPWIPRELVAPDGWFVTGDIGRLDEAGFLFLISRQAAVINLAGRKIFPEEVEAVLNRHPAVRESRVFGRKHPRLGETVEAEIVPQPAGADLASLREYCRTRLASYKIPTGWQVVSDLPRTAVSGKIRRVEQND